MFIMIKR